MAQWTYQVREYLATKLNPAQPTIARAEGPSYPENIIDYETAYREIDIIHRSIELIVSACVDLPLIVEGASAGKLGKLLNTKPNLFEDRNRLFRRAFLDFILDGNTFFYYDGTSGGLYVLPANNVKIFPDPKTFIHHYEYTVRIGTTSSDGFSYSRERDSKTQSVIFQPNEIIHIKNDSDNSIYRGDSKLKSLKRLIELYYALTDFQRQFFKNNAIPGFVLTTENVLSQKIKERLLAQWKDSYSSIFNSARSPAILDGGLKIDSFSSVNFQELDFENSVERLQQDLAKALGVPYVLMKSGNNANILANQTLFYYHTILPIVNQFCSAFKAFWEVDTIFPDKYAVAALQPDNKTQALYYSTLVNTGIITPNEARDGLRFEKSTEAEMDKIRIPQNITGSATDPSKGGRPSAASISQGR